VFQRLDAEALARNAEAIHGVAERCRVEARSSFDVRIG
jgi:hypothetical protein